MYGLGELRRWDMTHLQLGTRLFIWEGSVYRNGDYAPFEAETYADGPSRPRTGLSLEDRLALWANAMFSLEGCGVGYGRLVVLELFFFFLPNQTLSGCAPCFSEVNFT